MADGGVGHQLFDIRLDHGHPSAIDDGNRAEDHKRNLKISYGLRKKREGESQKTIAPHFQKHACQNHTSRSGSLDVSVWKPSMKREKRNLDGKGQSKR